MTHQQTPEERAKRSASLKAYYETHRHHSAGRTVSDETKAKISAEKLKWWADPAVKEHVTERIREAVQTPEHRAHMSQALMGRTFSAETLARMKVAHQGHKANPEAIEKTATANRGRKRRPEECARISTSQRALYASLSQNARQVRKDKVRAGWANRTAEEKRATVRKRHETWRANGGSLLENSVAYFLVSTGLDVRRNVRMGAWEADFFLPAFNVVLEVDGTYWHNLTEVRERDRAKDAYLSSQGMRVFRLQESDLKRDGIAACISAVLVKIHHDK